MSHYYSLIFSFFMLLMAPVAAEWGSDIMSIDAVKHWEMDDRVVHVRGTIIELIGTEGFRMRDDTGELKVHYTNHELRDFPFHTGERVEVRGRIEREHRHHGWDLEATAVKLHDDATIGYY